MIIEPDFLDHWKTQRLNRITGGKAAEIMIRLWAYCQKSKMWEFDDLSHDDVADIVRWTGDIETLWKGLIESKYLIDDNGKIIVHEWEKFNAGLIACWSNGSKGGRPSKQKPTGNPRVTHGKPTSNPLETDLDSDSDKTYSEGARSLNEELIRLMKERDPKTKATVSSPWLKAAEHLLTIDSRPLEESLEVLRFAKCDSFWCSNIMSMPKFREKYEALRAKWITSKNLFKPQTPKMPSGAEILALNASGGKVS